MPGTLAPWPPGHVPGSTRLPRARPPAPADEWARTTSAVARRPYLRWRPRCGAATAASQHRHFTVAHHTGRRRPQPRRRQSQGGGAAARVGGRQRSGGAAVPARSGARQQPAALSTGSCDDVVCADASMHAGCCTQARPPASRKRAAPAGRRTNTTRACAAPRCMSARAPAHPRRTDEKYGHLADKDIWDEAWWVWAALSCARACRHHQQQQQQWLRRAGWGPAARCPVGAHRHSFFVGMLPTCPLLTCLLLARAHAPHTPTGPTSPALARRTTPSKCLRCCVSFE
jgi:hypothetical protein